MNVDEWTKEQNIEDATTRKFFAEWYKKQHKIDPFIFPMTEEEQSCYRGFSNLSECYDDIFTYEFLLHCCPTWKNGKCVMKWVTDKSNTPHEDYWDEYELESWMGLQL